MKNFTIIAHIILFILVILVINSINLFADERGISSQKQQYKNSDTRTALVIGNSNYKFSPLSNPANDARNMANTLKQLGFRVISGENLTQKQMKALIFEFGDNLKQSGGVGLFYYAGHGVQVDGKNYLIPIGTNIRHEKHVELESVQVNRVLREMDIANNQMNIVILDACRNNPFARSFRSSNGGLASIDASVGTFIAYATAPGKTASDGPGSTGLYTGELIKWMKVQGLRIEDVFKKVRTAVRRKSNNLQIPWESSSLEGDFFFTLNFTQRRTEPLVKTKLKPVSSLGDTLFIQVEKFFFNKDYANSIAINKLYISKYPNSSNSPKALYYLAESYYQERKEIESLSAYVDLIDKFPESPESNTARQRLRDLNNLLKVKSGTNYKQPNQIKISPETKDIGKPATPYDLLYEKIYRNK